MCSLVRTNGVPAATRLIWARLRQADAAAMLGRGPIARLVETDAFSARSVPCFAGNIALIGSLDLAQCRKFRVIQKQEMIECVAGQQIRISHYRDIYRSRSLLQSADKLVLYRVPNGAHFNEIIAEARRLGLGVCYDIDDPVFDLETVKSNPNLSFLSRQMQRALFRDAVVFSEAMRQCDIITVSTPGLRRLVNQRFPSIPCYVIPNGVDAETIHYGAVARHQGLPSHDRPFRILMPSGSLAHAADTEVAVEGVRRFLDRCPEAQIVTIGHFHPEYALRNANAVKTLPFLPYSEYMRLLATADCVLVPLAESVFNDGKSIARLIDATEVGVPVVASPIGEYAEAALSSAFFPARSPTEWCEALEIIAQCGGEKSRVVRAALQRVRAPRLLSSLWANLDPELRAFFGSRAPSPSSPLVEAGAPGE
jgi:glycosyltransferase involved in cell wall biosynthesis